MSLRGFGAALLKNINLILLLLALACLPLALEQVTHNAHFPLLPVVLVAALCGWRVAQSQLIGRQAAGRLISLGIPGVFIYVAELVIPLGKVILTLSDVIFQSVLWLFNRSPINSASMLGAWIEFSSRVVVATIRLWEWSISLVIGEPVSDLAATGLAWGILLWVIGSWAGWQLRRNRSALNALTPGGVALTLTIEYSHMGTALVIQYLAIFLVLSVLSHYEEIRARWHQRDMDYSESIAFDFALITVPIIVLLLTTATLTQSFSLQEFIDKLQESKPKGNDRITEPLNVEPQSSAAMKEAYRSDGLPRHLLLSTPAEQLQDLVMIVTIGESLPNPESDPNRYYWRTTTYDLYTSVGWSSRSAKEVELLARTKLAEPPPTYQIVEQQIEMVNDQSERVYWTGTLVQADVDIKIAWRVLPHPPEDAQGYPGDMLGALTQASTYTVESFIPQASIERLQAAGRNYPPEISRQYLSLPETIPERVLILARDLTSNILTPYDQALAIETYLRNFPYTLEVAPPPFGQDVVDYFLFTAQKGYCDYYASAMVVMARAIGLPARIVVGYASGDYDHVTRQYFVRRKDAHSWVEIYFPEIGWVEFEPTGSQPIISHTDIVDEIQDDLDQSAYNAALPWIKAHWLPVISTLGGQALFLSIGLIIVLVLWLVAQNIYLRLIPASLAIERIYTNFENAATHLLPNLLAGHTPLELQTALTQKTREAHNILFMEMHIAIEKLVTLYSMQTFSQHPPSEEQVRSGIKIWARLRWRLWVARAMSMIGHK